MEYSPQPGSSAGLVKRVVKLFEVLASRYGQIGTRLASTTDSFLCVFDERAGVECTFGCDGGNKANATHIKTGAQDYSVHIWLVSDRYRKVTQAVTFHTFDTSDDNTIDCLASQGRCLADRHLLLESGQFGAQLFLLSLEPLHAVEQVIGGNVEFPGRSIGGGHGVS